ncbi:MAG: lysophospholipid acyltransferase family protein [Verrucomicrobia bacterium]|nr:lysophospholipid acyltransferase family protein [Verrucomicrobiota bacterium]MCG2679738.1 lysophospholipid acyltransferase family protein [Kiritimatiellia bacterium]MBU4248576.1 lysophospholipid acyltransferase family protein [Verrucomicrobiota bacterium]MBU4291550.1 lysophospholipid acyltransferase family protein [Verrucomicrobiota bacterium]MBU4428896.1 lysophospholipid acyltransferase family protein [Verrucomicrobiota bacterium]
MKTVIKLLTAWASRLSGEAALRMGRRLGWLLGTVCRYRRAEALETLQRCFPEKSATELRTVAEGMYANLGLYIVETMRMETLDREWLPRNVEVKGLDIVREVLARGKGAVMLSAHIGNFELPSLIAGYFGIPITVITKTIKPAALDEYWTTSRTRLGVKTVSRRGTFRACLAALKANEVLGFILDQNMKRKDGIFVEFFGRPACTSPGLAYLSAMAGSPVIPIFNIRQPNSNHCVEVMPALPPPPDRKPETIHQATQTYTAIIESVIRKHPDQWIWIHRRWRTQPLPESVPA